LTAFAGASRTDQAMPQFLTYSLPDDGGFLVGSLSAPPVTPGVPARSLALNPLEQRIVDLPQVVAYFRAPYLYLATHRTGRVPTDLTAIGAADPDLLRGVDRPLLLAGHLPSPKNPFAVTVNQLATEADHLHVGSTVRLYAYSLAQIQSGNLTGAVEHVPVPKGPSYAVRVAAIVRSPEDVTAVAPLEARIGVIYEGDRDMYMTSAFLSRLAAGIGLPVQQFSGINLVGVRLRNGMGDFAKFAAAATAIGGNNVFPSPGNVYGFQQAAASAEQGIHLDVVALLLFGGLAAMVTFALVGQGVARQSLLESEDYATLRSLGATRAQISHIVLLRSGLIGASGAALAFVVAMAASPLMPVGLARQADVHPGFAVDLAVLVPGALAIGVAIVSWALAAFMVFNKRSGSAADGRRLAYRRAAWAQLSKSPLPPEAVIGTRLALEPGTGRTAVPVMTAMLTGALAVAMLAAALTFGTSLNHLVTSPRQQGWNWDALVGNPNDLNDRIAQDGKLLAHDRFVGAYSAIAILDGHPPQADDQIVFGPQTLKKLHRSVGQSVKISTPQGVLTLKIVGRVIVPSVGDLFSNEIGDGGWVYGPAVRKQQAQQQAASSGASNATPPTVFNLFAVRYAKGVAPNTAYASLRDQFGPIVMRWLPSEDVLNLESVDWLPFILAGLVGLLGAAIVGNTLITSVRRRSRDLAVLKTIGLTPRQVASVIAWQATTFSFVALIVGVPLGIVAGRWAWNLVASNIGSATPPFVPVLAIILVVPAVVAVCNIMAAVPGWVAARVPPATTIRSE
jgi:ABC-type antimicrobial peptide transport system permease subunit